MVTATNVRSGRATALLASFQSAKGVVVDDFSSAVRLWTEEARIPIAGKKSDEESMLQGTAPEEAERYTVPAKPEGMFRMMASPTNLELLLGSNWGDGVAVPAFPGDPPNPLNYVLASQVSDTRWLTIAWVENTVDGGPGQLVRLVDCWFHTIRFIIDATGKFMIEAAFAGQQVATPVDLASLGGVTLPTSYTPDQNVFSGRSCSFLRDPAGSNVGIRFSRIELLLLHGLAHEWDQLKGKWFVAKAGRARARMTVFGTVSDEGWAVITNAIAGTLQRFRLSAAAPNPSRTLTMDFFGTDFEIEPLGHDGQSYRELRLSGQAHLNPGVNGSVTIELTQ